MSTETRIEFTDVHLPISFEISSSNVTARLGQITVVKPIEGGLEFDAKRAAVLDIQHQIPLLLAEIGCSDEEETHS